MVISRSQLLPQVHRQHTQAARLICTPLHTVQPRDIMLRKVLLDGTLQWAVDLLQWERITAAPIQCALDNLGEGVQHDQLDHRLFERRGQRRTQPSRLELPVEATH